MKVKGTNALAWFANQSFHQSRDTYELRDDRGQRLMYCSSLRDAQKEAKRLEERLGHPIVIVDLMDPKRDCRPKED